MTTKTVVSPDLIIYKRKNNKPADYRTVDLNFKDSSLPPYVVEGDKVKGATYMSKSGKYRHLFKMSLNDAIKSDYIAVQLDGVFDDPSVCCAEICIPSRLYTGLRHNDLTKLIALWVGMSSFHSGVSINSHATEYNYNDIARVAQALCLSQNVRSLVELDTVFPPYASAKSMADTQAI